MKYSSKSFLDIYMQMFLSSETNKSLKYALYLPFFLIGIQRMEIYERVLHMCCCNDAKQIYSSLSDESKKIMLVALKSVVETRNMEAGNRKFSEEHPSILFSRNPEIFKNVFVKSYDEKSILLCEAIQLSGGYNYITDFTNLLDELERWGQTKLLYQLLFKHSRSISRSSYVQNNPGMFCLNSDITAIKNDTSNTDFSKLQQVFVSDLKVFSSAKGKYLEGELIADPWTRVGITTFLEDDKGDYVQLHLHNVLPLARNKHKMAEQKFPKGLRLKISEPFYKIFKDGNLGIRVDTPNELQVEEIIVKTTDEIRREGREHFKSGNFFAALKTYFKGIVQYKDTVGVILNNRAQAEVKLEENEQALLDSAAVLMFEDNRGAKQRYQVAANKLGLKMGNISSIRKVWQRVLQKIDVLEDCGFESNKERGNEYYRKGNYWEAKKHYTASLREQEVCFLLNNIAVICIKLCIFQTAIASAAACLRITVDKKVAAKSRYCMAKAFSSIGEVQFSKLSSVSEASCERYWKNIQDAKSHVKMIQEYYLRDYLMSGESPTETLKKFSNVEIAGD